MIKEPITFILGSGVSQSYGYPTGKLLKTNIREILLNFFSGNPDYKSIETNYLNHLHLDYKTARSFFEDFKGSEAGSIDEFLENYSKEYGHFGKALIALILLKSELNSSFEFDESPYNYIFSNCIDGIDDLPINVNFITFNYDLSLEYYIYYTFKKRFNISEEKAIEILNQFNIIHLHGRLGYLNFEKENGRKYGKYLEHFGKNPDLTLELLNTCKDNINIIYEVSVSENKDFIKAHRLIEESSFIIFLGLGYDRTNINRLKIHEHNPGVLILGSTFDYTNQEIKRIASYFKYLGSTNISLESTGKLNAYDFLRNDSYFQLNILR